MASAAPSARGGASQPASGMAPLKALNKSSCKVATFMVRPCSGRVVQYTYQQKKDNKSVTAYKFEAWLLGECEKDYCIG